MKMKGGAPPPPIILAGLVGGLFENISVVNVFELDVVKVGG